MNKYLDDKKINSMIDDRWFKNVFLPISTMACFVLSIFFYKTIDHFFVFLHPENVLYETPAQEMLRDFSANLIDQTIKFSLSTVVFFATYTIIVAVLIFVFCRNKK